MDQTFRYKETILRVRASKPLDFVDRFLIERWQELERYIASHPLFLTSLDPVDAGEGPEIVKRMAGAGKMAGTGPMAAVAGAIGELLVERALEEGVEWIIVENGGDIAMYGNREFSVGLFAGQSPLSNRIALLLNPNGVYGICTSSSSVGHSLSFGDADAVVVFSPSATISDAFATSIANKTENLKDALSYAKEHTGREIDGALIVKGKKIARIGKIPKIVGVEE